MCTYISDMKLKLLIIPLERILEECEGGIILPNNSQIKYSWYAPWKNSKLYNFLKEAKGG